MSELPPDEPRAGNVFDRLRTMLSEAAVQFRVLTHEPVFTSEQAAAVRGTSLHSGAKALVVKVDDEVALFVLPADRKLDSKKLRKSLGARNSRFATADEVLALTGLRPGSIPPFGSLFGLDTYCDSSLGENETINFNAGDHSISVSMSCADYLRVESPRMLDFAGA